MTNFDELTCRHLSAAGDIHSGQPAANFSSHVGVEGNIDVSGRVNLLNGDLAEEFGVDTAEMGPLSAGTVVSLSGQGEIRQSSAAYDKCVAGVVSGAGEYEPAIVLDRKNSATDRVPVAITGKVACNVDASYGPVKVGDLLTTSSTPGHAMKASDPERAFGAVIGKALRPISEGRGLVPILVALQ